jgi:universal stress protein A
MLAFRTILTPVDFSESSDAGFQVAAALARDYRATLYVLHVAEPPALVPGEEELLAPERERLREELWQRLEQYQAPNLGRQVEYLLEVGDPATEILRVAGEIKCDLIVVGMHGYTGLKRLLMGSVAEAVVRKAACPVLTMKIAPGLNTETNCQDEQPQTSEVAPS